MKAPVPVFGLLVVGAFVAIGAAGLPWYFVRPNRVAEGVSVFLGDTNPLAAVAVGVLSMLPFVLLTRRDWLPAAGAVASLGVLLVTLTTAALDSQRLAAPDPFIRVSLSWGFWFELLGTLAVLSLWARDRRRRPILAATTILTVAALAAGFAGAFDGLSLVKEYHAQEETFWTETLRHLSLAGTAVAAGSALGLTVGWGAFRVPRLRDAVFAVLGGIQTMPSLALFGLLIAPLAWLGVGGVGAAPALLVLSLYAAFPVARSTLTALQNLDPGVVDAAQGVGMSRGQILWSVQVPLALPVILAGLRTSSVQAVGNTVVAALIGAGGLGSLVFFGLGQYAPDLILLGTLPALVLALLVDQLWALVLRLAPRTS